MATVSDSENLGESIMALVHRVRFKCEERDEKLRNDAGLSPAEFHVVCTLDEGEVVTGSVFAEKIGLSPSRSSRIVDKMLKEEYITVDRNSNDRRSIFVTLTAKGVDLKNQITSGQNECSQHIVDSLKQDERIEIADALERLLSIL